MLIGQKQSWIHVKRINICIKSTIPTKRTDDDDVMSKAKFAHIDDNHRVGRKTTPQTR
jgi:hypothetical protein